MARSSWAAASEAISASRLVGFVPGARLDLVEDAGHLVRLEAPDRLTEILRRWLSLGR
jgi:pimeloyl-ACP methyl ester carboxylesterase